MQEKRKDVVFIVFQNIVCYTISSVLSSHTISMFEERSRLWHTGSLSITKKQIPWTRF